MSKSNLKEVETSGETLGKEVEECTQDKNQSEEE